MVLSLGLLPHMLLGTGNYPRALDIPNEFVQVSAQQFEWQAAWLPGEQANASALADSTQGTTGTYRLILCTPDANLHNCARATEHYRELVNMKECSGAEVVDTAMPSRVQNGQCREYQSPQ